MRIRIPASTSNLGSAFDAAGLALQLYLRLEIIPCAGAESHLEYRGPDERLVPNDESNLIWRTMRLAAERAGKVLPAFSMIVDNEIPITKGLGSSAAATLAGIAAADHLCRLELDRKQWLTMATEIEGHPDNAAAALWGGLVFSIGNEEIYASRCEFPHRWTIVAVTPDFELETKVARSVLPAHVPHRDAVFNVQRAAFLAAQLARGQGDGLREAMSDRLHQPYRSPLIPGLEEILSMEDCQGLLGIALSGAGPTVAAIADSREQEIGARVQAVFRKHGLSSQVRLLRADHTGVTPY